MKWIAFVSAAAFAAVSAYGWWSYLSVNSGHGGLELALAGGMLAAVALLVAVAFGGERN